MDARNNLKIIHTVDGAILQNRYGKAVIRSHDIGLISLPTGEIVVADPTLRFEIADFKPEGISAKGPSRHISCVRVFRSYRRGPHTCVCGNPFYGSPTRHLHGSKDHM